MENRIKVVMIGVLNMRRAVHFWRDIAEFTLKFETPTYSEFDTKGAVLALEKRDIVHADGPAFTIESGNIQSDIATLEVRGVTLHRELREEDFGLVALLKDSEGNIFELAQYKKKS